MEVGEGPSPGTSLELWVLWRRWGTESGTLAPASTGAPNLDCAWAVDCPCGI